MSIRFTNELFPCDRERIDALYGREGSYDLFERSYAHVLAYEENVLLGAVRAVSEGVETVLVVDLRTEKVPGEDVEKIALGLLTELETKLRGRRVMLYGEREQLALLEKAGYGRCKNAWTLFREGFPEQDFLPPGYRFESEFLPRPKPAAKEEDRKAENATKTISYPGSRAQATDSEINELLTKAFFGRPHDINKTAKAFAASSYVATAYDGDKLVGVARAVADGGRYATILNVAVDPEYQGLSIGKNMLLELSGRITEPTVVLNTHPGAVGFYNRIREYRRNRYVFEKYIPEEGEPERPANPEFRIHMFTPAGYRFPDEYETGKEKQ